MDKVIVDCRTGDEARKPLTDAELAQRDEDVAKAAEEAALPPAPTPDERLAALEAQVEAAAALAEQANVTAQDVAKAMRDADPSRP